MTIDRDTAGRTRLSYAWVILAISFLTISTTVTLRFSFGFFFGPIETEFGWDRTTLSTAVAINMIVYGVFQPLAGRLADRLGPKWVIVPSVALVGAGFGLIGQITSVWGLYLFFGGLVGAGLAGTAFVTQSALVGGWFTRHRPLALGVSLSGASAGTTAAISCHSASSWLR